MTISDNFRLIQKAQYDRIENLTTIIHGVNGFTAAFFTAILTIIGSAYFDPKQSLYNKALILGLIGLTSIIELCLWRLYAHFLDCSIVESYKKIGICEDLLRIPKNISIKGSIKSNENAWDRGHLVFDLFALSGVLIGFYLLGYSYPIITFFEKSIITILFILFVLICTGRICLFYVKKNEEIIKILQD
jgi:hypothetical protein